MQEQILVPLKRHEPVEELVPYLELLAPAGSTVVFLIPITANLFPWWSEALTVLANELKSAMPLSVLAAKASRERQLQAATEQIAAARRALETKGVIVQIDCFLGGIEKELARLGETATHTLVLQGKSRGLLVKSLGCFSFVRRRIVRSRGATMMLTLPRQSG